MSALFKLTVRFLEKRPDSAKRGNIKTEVTRKQNPPKFRINDFFLTLDKTWQIPLKTCFQLRFLLQKQKFCVNHFRLFSRPKRKLIYNWLSRQIIVISQLWITRTLMGNKRIIRNKNEDCSRWREFEFSNRSFNGNCSEGTGGKSST